MTLLNFSSYEDYIRQTTSRGNQNKLQVGDSPGRLIKKVKAKPFNIDFEKQCEAMDTFKKPTIAIRYDMDRVEEPVNQTNYGEKVKKRVCSILRLQQGKC